MRALETRILNKIAGETAASAGFPDQADKFPAGSI
jgi:hypothetical protein